MTYICTSTSLQKQIILQASKNSNWLANKETDWSFDTESDVISSDSKDKLEW